MLNDLKIRTSCLALAIAVPLAMAGPAFAAQDGVVATVNGEVITEADLQTARADLGQSLSNVPEAQQRDYLVSFLVDMHLLAQEARRREMQNAEGFEDRVEFMRDRLLMQDILESEAADAVTDEALQKVYDDVIANQEPKEEIRARHILVETEEKAVEVQAELDGGKDFAEAAKEHSTGPSGPNGGDLGFFGKGRMVPEFEAVAFALDEGSVSDPVKTQFGWHVIKVEEKRVQPPPPFDAVKGQIAEFVTQQAQRGFIEELRKAATIETEEAATESGADKPAE